MGTPNPEAESQPAPAAPAGGEDKSDDSLRAELGDPVADMFDQMLEAVKAQPADRAEGETPRTDKLLAELAIDPKRNAVGELSKLAKTIEREAWRWEGEAEAHGKTAHNAAIREHALRTALRKLTIGTCSCMTKTPDTAHHSETCTYRIAAEGLKAGEETP